MIGKKCARLICILTSPPVCFTLPEKSFSVRALISVQSFPEGGRALMKEDSYVLRAQSKLPTQPNQFKTVIGAIMRKVTMPGTLLVVLGVAAIWPAPERACADR